MNKKLKEELIKRNVEMRAAFPSLYDKRWVEKSADKGWKNLVNDLKKTDPKLGELAERQEGFNMFAVIYYTSFEDALNTFFLQCMNDSITKINLLMDELHKVSAEIKTKEV